MSPTKKKDNRETSRMSKSKLTRVKEIFTIWSHSSDINCYTKIFMYKDNWIVQMIWIAILIGSTCATNWLITKTILDYYEYQVVSQTDIFYEVPTQFPAVTICDNDPFTSKYSEALYYMRMFQKRIILVGIQ